MRTRFCGSALLATALLLGAQPAAAQGTLTSKVELEKLMSASPGQPAVKSYSAPDVVVPGDRVRITLTFTNGGAAPAAGAARKIGTGGAARTGRTPWSAL